MTSTSFTPAPVGPQAPPTRAEALDSFWSLRVARGALPWTTGTACGAVDERHKG